MDTMIACEQEENRMQRMDNGASNADVSVNQVPSSRRQKQVDRRPAEDASNEPVAYQSLVVDSGPIIRLTGSSALWKKAQKFYTVPAVLDEIRDAKARQHLDKLPFELMVREASPSGIQAVANFARQTGDYHSLSTVDIQVLGLLYDLEQEGCSGDMSHIRTTPKRVIGLGPINVIGGPKATSSNDSPTDAADDDIEYGSEASSDQDSTCAGSDVDDDKPNQLKDPNSLTSDGMTIQKPKSWAKIVDPSAKGIEEHKCSTGEYISCVAVTALQSTFGSMKIRTSPPTNDDHGQFSDAEDDPLSPPTANHSENQSVQEEEKDSLEEELKLDFPSLAAAATVPFEVEDVDPAQGHAERLRIQREEDEARKKQSLRPVSKSGKLYNSFRKYGDLMKPKQQKVTPLPTSGEEPPAPTPLVEDPDHDIAAKQSSRIIGGTALAGQEADVEDDGEGWITSTTEIHLMKASGALDPSKQGAGTLPLTSGPAASQRAACATTDFAMQNVILQMNLELLSVDGMKVRKLKSFVTRCGACFKVYASQENTGPLGKRLFCDKCGSDMMQRIAASVDGKTGRLRLHLSKRYKHNLRGTKFSLPKPGTGDRFKGDLLLREDQLLMGAWNQKVKMSSGGRARASAESMFGKDLASNLGCKTSTLHDEIRVGFGRQNPNSVKGRERRGKKKKSSDKACGLRRY